MSDHDGPKRYERGHVEHGPDVDVRRMHAPIIREKSEPSDGYEPVPIWLMFIYFGIIGWVGVYLGMYNGGFDPNRYAHEPGAGVVQTSEQAVQLSLQDLGERLYKLNCVACHQTDGRGLAGQFPPLTGSRWVTEDPGTPVRILLNGLNQPIEVAGETYNGQMPAFGARFDDRQIAAVLSYVRQAWDNDAPEIAPGFVRAVREQTSRTGAWTADTLVREQQTEIEWSPSEADEEPPGDGESEEGG